LPECVAKRAAPCIEFTNDKNKKVTQKVKK
jgi:hypothetical protein